MSSRDSHGGEGRIKAARFPARKTLEEFDFTFQRSVKKTVAEHLGQLDFCRKQSATAASRPSCAGCRSSPLIVIDEVGYIRFDPEAANLMFSLVSSRYERASMIVTSNTPFSAWVRSSATTWPPPR